MGFGCLGLGLRGVYGVSVVSIERFMGLTM